MADRPQMFGPIRGFSGDGRFNGTTQNVAGPTLVAMATKFGLGAEILSPTGLYVCMYVGFHYLRQEIKILPFCLGL